MSLTRKPIRLIHIAAITALAALTVSPVHAQRSSSNPIELGADAAFSRISSDGDSFTRLAIPLEFFRVGFFVSDRVSIEPSMRLTWGKFGDGDGTTSYDINTGLLIHTRKVRNAPQLFFKPLVGFTGYNANESRSQPYFGLGGGLKVHGNNRMAFRTGLEYQRALESGPLPDQDRFHLLIGLSYFTR
ncbi:MAG: hypothetical protein IBJ03_08860 [Gemmatimonadaceae bacterium]|nr:hypothetical protein [Gemmatimonadaceae bacterium]